MKSITLLSQTIGQNLSLCPSALWGHTFFLHLVQWGCWSCDPFPHYKDPGRTASGPSPGTAGKSHGPTRGDETSSLRCLSWTRRRGVPFLVVVCFRARVWVESVSGSEFGAGTAHWKRSHMQCFQGRKGHSPPHLGLALDRKDSVAWLFLLLAFSFWFAILTLRVG